MGGDIGQARPHGVAHGAHLGVVQLGIKGDDHIVGVLVVHGHFHLFKLCGQDMIAQQEGFFSGEVGLAIAGRGLAGGEDIEEGLPHVHFAQLLDVMIGALGGVVGQKQHPAARALHGVQEIQAALQDLVAQIEGAVHIQHEAFDLAQPLPQLLRGKAVDQFRYAHGCFLRLF